MTRYLSWDPTCQIERKGAGEEGGDGSDKGRGGSGIRHWRHINRDATHLLHVNCLEGGVSDILLSHHASNGASSQLVGHDEALRNIGGKLRGLVILSSRRNRFGTGLVVWTIMT